MAPPIANGPMDKPSHSSEEILGATDSSRSSSEEFGTGRAGTFYPWPLADSEVRAALERCFADGSWGCYHGPHCDRLCAELARLHDAQHVRLCSSGTLAIELALRGLKVAAGDEVILAGYDFPGNFRAIEAIGARPVLVDIEPDTWCLDPAHLPAAMSSLTRAIVVSHLHGGMADMKPIMAFAADHGLAVVEDACQSPGATVNGRTAGAWGDAGVLSFGGSKLLTAGRGGAILTRHTDVLQRIKVFAERGNDAFPLSELQAAVLVPQLARLSERNDIRRTGVNRILSATAKFGALRPLKNRRETQPSFYKLAWLWDAGQVSPIQTREEFIAAAHAQRIPIAAGFRGFALRSSRRCRIVGELIHSVAAASQTILLHHPVLLAPAQELDRMIVALADVLNRAGRIA
jgi:dTDP-4-amino-4,6-dideoxygalactose transaminase